MRRNLTNGAEIIQMDKDGLVFGHITEYMRLLRRERTDALGDLEHRAREEKNIR